MITVLIMMIFVVVPMIVLIGYIMYFLIKALRKYVQSSNVRKESDFIKKSLGETIKDYRIQQKMTQEFVAEHLGVSRQAVSKWESGVSDPSTSNLIALARLFNVSPEELLKNVD